MKKLVYFILFTACFLSGCQNNVEKSSQEQSSQIETAASGSETEEGAAMENPSETTGEGKALVAYFSWAENAQPGDIDAVSSPSVTMPGNVAQFASWIAEETGADRFSIQVTDPYPPDWDSCLSRANREKGENARPELTRSVDNMADYDVIFLGYPNWWYSCPMAILSFIESHDFSGKEIYLFCSHGTGGLAGSVEDITAALPDDCSVSDQVFHAYEEDTADSRDKLNEWLEGIGFQVS